jgi:hypothetical protein
MSILSLPLLKKDNNKDKNGYSYSKKMLQKCDFYLLTSFLKQLECSS